MGMIDSTKERRENINKIVDSFIDELRELGETDNLQKLHNIKQAQTLGSKLFRARLYWASAPDHLKTRARSLAYLIYWDMEEAKEERFEYQMELMRRLVEVENELEELKSKMK